jgi:hypothetical protein
MQKITMGIVNKEMQWQLKVIRMHFKWQKKVSYRNHQVYITNSMHVPLNSEAVIDAMPVLIELLAEESEAFCRIIKSFG